MGHFDDDDIARLEALEDELGRLKEAVQYLVHCKQTDAGFGFFNWLVQHDVFDARRARLEHVLGVLEERLGGESVAPGKALAGIDERLLYEDAPPTVAAVRTLLSQALGGVHAQVVAELMEALAGQMPERPLVVWWLENAR